MSVGSIVSESAHLTGRSWAATKSIWGGTKGYLNTNVHRAGWEFIKGEFGFGQMAAKGWARAFSPAFFLYSAYEGYREGGVQGAIKGAAQHTAFMYAMGSGIQLAGAFLGNPILLGSALAVGGTLGYIGGKYKLANAIRSHMSKHSRVEMGRPMIDPFGNMATMRQRSIMAMQRSKINGRSALGNEASLVYRPYHR